MRFGLCCKFAKESIKFRTTTITYLKKIKNENSDHLKHLSKVILDNCTSLKTAIKYCHSKNIGCFRVSSDFFPAITHDDLKYSLDELDDFKKIEESLSETRKLCQKYNIRTTLHPDQFVVLNSPNQNVVKNSIKNLHYHDLLANYIGADVINIHLGGVYGDKNSAIGRFHQNFQLLSESTKNKLTLENDDKSYSPEEILHVCNTLNIPFVYDVHHHRCHKDTLSIEQATHRALKSWNREPLFHISSPKNGWSGKNKNQHHDLIDIEDFPMLWNSIHPLTVEIEAKAKEIAIFKLRKELNLIKN